METRGEHLGRNWRILGGTSGWCNFAKHLYAYPEPTGVTTRTKIMLVVHASTSEGRGQHIARITSTWKQIKARWLKWWKNQTRKCPNTATNATVATHATVVLSCLAFLLTLAAACAQDGSEDALPCSWKQGLEWPRVCHPLCWLLVHLSYF